MTPDASRLITLGRLSLLDSAGREDPTLATRRRKLALLAWLAMRPAQRATRDQIVALLWGNRDDARARSSLSDALWHLRQVLGRGALASDGEDVVITGEARMVVDALELGLASGRDDHDRVVELYGGPFLDGVYVDDARDFDDWRDRERDRLASLFTRSARVVTAKLAAAARWDECRALAERWLEAEPLAADAALRLMESLAAPGTRQALATALDAYERLVRRLDDDYEAQPDHAVTAASLELTRRLRDNGAAPPAGDRHARFLDHLNRVLAGRYQTIRLLERTSLAMIVLARDASGVEHALRVLHPALASTLDVDVLLGELRRLMELRHASLVPIIDAGASEGIVYFATPVIEGESLRERLTRERPLAVSDAVWVAGHLAEALAAAHGAGVLHLDLKPRHVWLSVDGVRLAESGLARAIAMAAGNSATRSGVTLGTPAYMAPEQVTGGRLLDTRTDLYSLGSLFYEMLCGAPPFAGPTAQAALVRRLNEAPARVRATRPNVPVEIEALVARLLERVPDDRCASATEVRTAIDRAR